jgi:hypothetical protein
VGRFSETLANPVHMSATKVIKGVHARRLTRLAHWPGVDPTRRKRGEADQWAHRISDLRRKRLCRWWLGRRSTLGPNVGLIFSFLLLFHFIFYFKFQIFKPNSNFCFEFQMSNPQYNPYVNINPIFSQYFYLFSFPLFNSSDK